MKDLMKFAIWGVIFPGLFIIVVLTLFELLTAPSV
jgi:ABC-type dipeptide/oligopeptide/nickel transport system permease subunit